MNDTREKILDVSSKLFVEHSYKEVSIQDIVDQVGMTKGAFYYFFKSKEELFIELYSLLSQLFKPIIAAFHMIPYFNFTMII